VDLKEHFVEICVYLFPFALQSENMIGHQIYDSKKIEIPFRRILYIFSNF
jgi:hypothetical protein